MAKKEPIAMTLKVGQAKDAIRTCMAAKLPVMLWGPPGVGKSDAIRQLGEEQKRPVIDLRMSLLNPVDLRGVPVAKAGKTDWWAPCFLPQSGTDSENAILFLDEMNAAPNSVQAAAYQLVLDRRVGEYVLPDGVDVIAAGNRGTDRAIVYDMSSALRNRFMHYEVVEDLDEWKDWAMKNGIRDEIVSFLNYKQDRLFYFDPKVHTRQFPTPRCLDPKTTIWMADGSQKKIKDICEGDMVIGFNHRTNKYEPTKVLKTFRTRVKDPYVVSTGNKAVRCSGEHHFFTDSGYVQAKDLRDGETAWGCIYQKGKKGSEYHRLVKGRCRSRRDGGFVRESTKLHLTDTEISYIAGLLDGEGSIFLTEKKRWGKKWYEPQMSIHNCSLLFRDYFERMGCKVNLEKRKHKSGNLQDKYTVIFYGRHVFSVLEQLLPFLALKKPVALAMMEYIRESWRTPKGKKLELSDRQKELAGLIATLNSKNLAGIYETQLDVMHTLLGVDEEFCDFETELHNYVAEGFLVHNSWEYVSRLMNNLDGFRHAAVLFAGGLGDGVANEFMGFLRVAGKLPNAEDIILKGNMKIKAPEESAQQYAFSGALVGVATRAKDKMTAGKNLSKYCTEQLPSAFAVLTCKDYARTETFGSIYNKLTMTEEWKAFAEKYGEFIIH